MTVIRWEDDALVWSGPYYGGEALHYDDSVATGFAAGRIITCPEVVDWSGDGSRDLLLSSWDACYDGVVVLRRQVGTNPDGTPILGPEEVLDGIRGYTTAVPDGDIFHLVTTSRLRRQIYLYRNVGRPGAPIFDKPLALDLNADWVHENEYFHLARFADIDGDGSLELVVGTDYWGDYWPNGLEWNDEGYRAYDAAGRWLGGPLRGFLYVFRNRGSLSEPVLEKGVPARSGENPYEVYGQFAPAFANFDGHGLSAVGGEFWNVLHFARHREGYSFEHASLLHDQDGAPLLLDQCIHIPCAVDWNNDGRVDLLVGAEDGYVTYLRNTGDTASGRPLFEKAGRIETTSPLIHGGVLPSPAAHDFSGNGLPDLVVGNSSGELLFYENIGTAVRPALARETMIEAGGKPVRFAAGLTGSIQGPSEKMFGYSCPIIADWDGDGLADILLSDVTGYHYFLRNDGQSKTPPSFHAPEKLKYEGRPLKTVWRVRPAVIDWTGSGELHYVALDEKGKLSDYQRASDTELVHKRYLTFDNGETVTFTPDVGGGRGRIKLCACDWNGSGTTDLIVGTHARASLPPGPHGAPRNTTGQAGLFYLENIGSNEVPVFASPRPFRFQGEIIAMGMHVASPEYTDWDGSGEGGLLVGVEDGSIVWLPRKYLTF
ncbi:FG-GAP repeat domain-containing protein [Pseudohoeflea coraliihabitans]|uniref:VCBS repeat-containing protein n=1 Tax=Pseudohoeflea coraliihabitans TaxID=2860393 RepID=A0ABS6WJB1_9HYPH|nr:VCBS repeat-containing protein [Pseudohoeflea sp. DP4N28-3]MBW3096037.1 VCBS repeat-containing protein [Pseudohoeflea sp. DP4N28-3]